MLSLLHRSIVGKLSILVFCFFCICQVARLAHAQHITNRNSGGVVHIPTSPIAHIPISPAPIVHVPMISAPVTTSRIPFASTGGSALSSAWFRPPRRPIRPFPPVFVIYESPFLFGGSFWGLNSCWWAACDLFWPGTFDYTTVSSPGPISYVPEVYETPYVYGEERPDLPQLFLKDGTTLSVTDYWLVEDQLHFTMIEEENGKPVEHVVPFDALDLQKTVDVNTRRGFRFMLRNEPFEQYVRDHPEGPPPAITPPHE